MNLYDYLYFCACVNLGRVVVDAPPFENEARQLCIELHSESWQEFLSIQNDLEFFSTQPAPEDARLHLNNMISPLLHIGDAVWWQINNIAHHNNIAILPLYDDIISKISAYLGLTNDADMDLNGDEAEYDIDVELSGDEAEYDIDVELSGDEAEYDIDVELSGDEAAENHGDGDQENRNSNLIGPSSSVYSFYHPAGPSKTPGPTHIHTTYQALL